MPIPAPKLNRAKVAFRHLVKLIEKAAADSEPTSGLRRDLATAQRAHPRPRGAEGIRAALETALQLARKHRALFVETSVELEERIVAGQSGLDALDEVMKARSASVRARSTTISPRTTWLATLKENVRTVRSAASVAFANTEPKLYRKFTSAYERTAKRAYRERAKAEPVPAKAVAGTPAKARRPRTRRVELVQQAAASARRERPNPSKKCG